MWFAPVLGWGCFCVKLVCSVLASKLRASKLPAGANMHRNMLALSHNGSHSPIGYSALIQGSVKMLEIK